MLSSVIALMAAAAAQIGDPSTANQPAASPPPSVAAQKDADKVVCRMITPTGQRLGGERVCHTKAEWEDISRRARDDTTSTQMRGMEGGVPGH
jgi:hypothetical protein